VFQRRRRQIDYRWIAPLGRLKRACSPSLLCILRSARTLLFQSCRAQLRPPVCFRWRLIVPRGRAQDYDHGRISWRQPVAHQPCHLRRGHAIRGRLQSEPRPDPRSKSYISRPDLCPSLESALKRGNRVSQRGPTALTVYAKTGSGTPHTSRLRRMLALHQNRTFLNVAFDPKPKLDLSIDIPIPAAARSLRRRSLPAPPPQPLALRRRERSRSGGSRVVSQLVCTRS